MVQAFLTLNNSIYALLIRHNHVDFCALKLYYVMFSRMLNLSTTVY